MTRTPPPHPTPTVFADFFGQSGRLYCRNCLDDGVEFGEVVEYKELSSVTLQFWCRICTVGSALRITNTGPETLTFTYQIIEE